MYHAANLVVYVARHIATSVTCNVNAVVETISFCWFRRGDVFPESESWHNNKVGETSLLIIYYTYTSKIYMHLKPTC